MVLKAENVQNAIHAIIYSQFRLEWLNNYVRKMTLKFLICRRYDLNLGLDGARSVHLGDPPPSVWLRTGDERFSDAFHARFPLRTYSMRRKVRKSPNGQHSR